MPCQSPARASGYCWAHDPTVAAERAAARSAGGKARHGRAIRYIPSDGPEPTAQTITITSAADVLALVNAAVADAMSMERSLNRARTLGSLAETALKVFQAVELEERVKALEQMINEGKP